ncbi:endonuclease/exonuclease/phosphatase family protein [Candidatus Dojkabacteria bacterium]|nr:endonuclease/exonuclease/phosphatase family protein [Candidatus Dojkabacteria bacterium]
MAKNTVSVVCLNCFGIPIPVHKKIRFKLIAEELDKISPDIIALQEVFVWTNRNILIDKLKDQYYIYPEKFLPFSSGGLITFIKNGIKVNKFKFSRFKDQGNKTLISIPDGIAGKGYQTFELLINKKIINFINCHLLCQYNRTAILESSYMKQIDELISTKSTLCRSIILSGDLNDHPESKAMSKLKTSIGLSENLMADEFTIDLDNLNRGKIMNIFSNGKPYRTDYTFVSNDLEIKSQSIVFKNPIEFNSKKYHLSDHYGVYTEINI